MTHAERSLRNVAPYSSTGSSSVTENPHTKRVRNGERKESNLCGDPGKCPHYFALRFDAAIREYESALDLNPNFAPGHWHLGWALEHVGRYDEAISHAQQAIDISEGNLLYVASLGHAYAIAGRTEEAAEQVQDIFQTPYFRVYTNTDVIGCELGGALKNIIAIAAGMGDGLGAGDNTRAAVITRGLAELSRLGMAMGGKSATFAGLAGMGDLVATCTSAQSRNRYVGEQLGKGRELSEIIAEMNMVAEGVKSVPAVKELAREYAIEMPIVDEVHRVVQEGGKAGGAFRGLLRIGSGAESDPG